MTKSYFVRYAIQLSLYEKRLRIGEKAFGIQLEDDSIYSNMVNDYCHMLLGSVNPVYDSYYEENFWSYIISEAEQDKWEHFYDCLKNGKEIEEGENK